MIVDTSALIAILREETEAPAMARALEEASECKMSAANFVEAAVVIDASRDPVASRRFDDLIREALTGLTAPSIAQSPDPYYGGEVAPRCLE